MAAHATRSDLHQLADELDDALVETAVEYLRSLALYGEGSGQTGLASAETESEHPDKPLWGIAGIGRSGKPTNIRKYKDQYLADAYAPKRR